MGTETATTQVNEAPQDAWARWQREHGDVLKRATGPQRILLEAAVRFVVRAMTNPSSSLSSVSHQSIFHFDQSTSTPLQKGFPVSRSGSSYGSSSQCASLR